MYEPIRVGRPVRTIAGRFAVGQLLASHLGTAAYIISATAARRTLADPRLPLMSADRYFFSRGGPVIPSRRLYQVDPAPGSFSLSTIVGANRPAPCRSDLKRDRDSHRANVPQPLGYRWRDYVAKATYTLRMLAHILPDAYARRQKRRAIPFEGDV